MWFTTEKALIDWEKQLASISASDKIEIKAAYGASDDGDSEYPRIMTVTEGVATIRVQGMLLPSENLFARYFGINNTGYNAIRQSIALAEGDDAIESIVLQVNSPGGTVEGLFATMDALNDFTKEKSVEVREMAASAAYGLAACCGRLVADRDSTRIGSVGTALNTYIDPQEVTLTSTKAPKKMPDPATEEGKAELVRTLDGMHAMFIGKIAVGRGVTTDKIDADFGQGAVVMAEEALKAGMIDAVAQAPAKVEPEIKTTAKRGNTKEAKIVDKTTLKAEHPELFAAVFEDGQKNERARIMEHLEMGKEVNDLELAFAAIGDGSRVEGAYAVKYTKSAMRAQSASNTADDDADITVDNVDNNTDETAEVSAGLQKLFAGLGATQGLKIDLTGGA